ncbi:tRNA pseudouridine(38-40) synthase TruA [Metallumcola ferriviriculae]|uniref:tRNA pseudouridine synthase A n=1 Tax=Metallumcola ferriviriculae TaxID=3039180 RepID=A0AAU0UJC5_9FIRM|nr:tRNA pseudouridine(38-40) synthase TruA [Desulfitibacteraceae bacterium MK1]
MPYISLTLQYDGTDFNGWQVQTKQPHSRTVQYTVEQALKLLTKEDIRVEAAGRTDAGVHARGQVISFWTNAAIPVDRYPRALNGILPRDVLVSDSGNVDINFHARFSARQKTYIYRVSSGTDLDIFWRRYSFHFLRSLDIDDMKRAAEHLRGRHDFRSFCASGSSITDFIREIKDCQVTDDGDMIEVSITADGFLYNMVRIIVGTMLEVGTGKKMVTDIPKIIAARNRGAAGATAPACGLTLERVIY